MMMHLLRGTVCDAFTLPAELLYFSGRMFRGMDSCVGLKHLFSGVTELDLGCCRYFMGETSDSGLGTVFYNVRTITANSVIAIGKQVLAGFENVEDVYMDSVRYFLYSETLGLRHGVNLHLGSAVGGRYQKTDAVGYAYRMNIKSIDAPNMRRLALVSTNEHGIDNYLMWEEKGTLSRFRLDSHTRYFHGRDEMENALLSDEASVWLEQRNAEFFRLLSLFNFNMFMGIEGFPVLSLPYIRDFEFCVHSLMPVLNGFPVFSLRLDGLQRIIFSSFWRYILLGGKSVKGKAVTVAVHAPNVDSIMIPMVVSKVRDLDRETGVECDKYFVRTLAAETDQQLEFADTEDNWESYRVVDTSEADKTYYGFFEVSQHSCLTLIRGGEVYRRVDFNFLNGLFVRRYFCFYLKDGIVLGRKTDETLSEMY